MKSDLKIMSNLRNCIYFSFSFLQQPRLRMNILRQLHAETHEMNSDNPKTVGGNTGNKNVNEIQSTSKKSPILERTLQLTNKYVTPRQIWVENLDTVKEEKKGLVELHPEIFATIPRLDLIQKNVEWQKLYRKVVLFSAKNRAEMPGSGKKPHPQKGLGKARQGSKRSPHMVHGGVAHGPRNPTSYFYMLPYSVRVHGLTSTLSAKFAQDDLHIVENLDIPTNESQYLLDLIKERKWGPSVLFVDKNDVMPRNITIATDTIGHVTLMPLYGLNVYGMLKHETLVLTLDGLNELEDQLIKVLNTANPLEFRKICRIDNYVITKGDEYTEIMEEQSKSFQKPETPLTFLLKSPQKSYSNVRSQTPLLLPQSLIGSVPVPSSLNFDARPAVTLQNVVATVNLMSELDLRKINFCTRNTEYNPARFKGLVMRIREPKTTALIFKTGKIVVTGAKSEEAALLAARKYARIIQKLGFVIKFCNFKVQNIVGTCDVRFPIKLESLNQIHGQFSSYEPELFPALIYRLVKPRVVLLIFVNGKIVLTGARTKQEIQEALDIMLPILKSFRKQ